MTTTPVQAANGPTPTGVPNDAESPGESRCSGPNRHPSPTVGKSRCQCPTCKAFFTSTGNFDAHRAWANDAYAALDRVRAAADTLTWQNDYGDAQQIIYGAIVGED